MLTLKEKTISSLEDFSTIEVNDWDSVKSRVRYKLMKKKVFEANVNNHEDIVHKQAMDLVKIYIIARRDRNREYIENYELTKQDLKNFGVTAKDVFEQADENYCQDKFRRIKTFTESNLVRETLYPLMKNMELMQLSGANAFIKDYEGYIDNVLIISNKYNVFGTSYMFQPDTLEIIKERMLSDFYILPLSIHQFMCVSSKYITQGKEVYEAEDDLLDMLFIINQESRNKETILTYNIYKYIEDERLLFAIKPN